MENIEDIILRWNAEEDMTDEEVEYCEQNLVIKGSDEIHNHQWVTYSTVYQDVSTEKFYKVWVKHTDTGYWGDSEKVDEGCFEVVPKEIIKTIYVAKEKT